MPKTPVKMEYQQDNDGESGKRITILHGPNGVGKTAILRLIGAIDDRKGKTAILRLISAINDQVDGDVTATDFRPRFVGQGLPITVTRQIIMKPKKSIVAEYRANLKRHHALVSQQIYSENTTKADATFTPEDADELVRLEKWLDKHDALMAAASQPGRPMARPLGWRLERHARRTGHDRERVK